MKAKYNIHPLASEKNVLSKDYYDYEMMLLKLKMTCQSIFFLSFLRLKCMHNLWIPLMIRCTWYNIMWFVICQWLATSWYFSPGTPVSSTNKTDRHDITEILSKGALITISLTHRYVWGIMYTLLKYISVKHHSPNSLYFIFLSFFIFSSHQIIDYLLFSFCTSFC